MPDPKRKQSPLNRQLLGITRSMEGLDLARLTGISDVFRNVSGFQSQVSPFTRLVDRPESVGTLFAGMSAMNAQRRDLLGTAFLASDVSKQISLAQKPFIDSISNSISTYTGAQLSLVAKQSMLGRQVTIGSVPKIGNTQAFSAFTKLNTDFHATIASAIPQNFGASIFGDSLRRITRPFATSVWRFLEQLQAADDEALLFVERHGWPLPLALPVRVVHRVARMSRSGKREVTAFMVGSFGPRGSAYRISRDRLLDSPHFSSRRQPLKQGIAAMNRGDYYASICTLLPLVEGALVDVVLADDPPYSGAPQKAVAQLRLAQDEIDALTVGAIETLLVSATSGSALFGYFDRRDYGGPGESKRLNRHAILHGSARRYGTHANALKLFLLLVALAETLDLHEFERDKETE